MPASTGRPDETTPSWLQAKRLRLQPSGKRNLSALVERLVDTERGAPGLQATALRVAGGVHCRLTPMMARLVRLVSTCPAKSSRVNAAAFVTGVAMVRMRPSSA